MKKKVFVQRFQNGNFILALCLNKHEVGIWFGSRGPIVNNLIVQ